MDLKEEEERRTGKRAAAARGPKWTAANRSDVSAKEGLGREALAPSTHPSSPPPLSLLPSKGGSREGGGSVSPSPVPLPPPLCA